MHVFYEYEYEYEYALHLDRDDRGVGVLGCRRVSLLLISNNPGGGRAAFWLTQLESVFCRHFEKSIEMFLTLFLAKATLYICTSPHYTDRTPQPHSFLEAIRHHGIHMNPYVADTQGM